MPESFGDTESAGVSDGGDVGVVDVLGGCVARSVARVGLSAVACMETDPGGIERAKGPKDVAQTGIQGMFRLVRRSATGNQGIPFSRLKAVFCWLFKESEGNAAT